jgi:hypothetical protein
MLRMSLASESEQPTTDLCDPLRPSRSDYLYCKKEIANLLRDYGAPLNGKTVSGEGRK